MPEFEDREYVRRVRKLVEDILANDPEAVRKALDLLERTRREVTGEIAGGGKSEFELANLRQMISALEKRIDEFRRELEVQLRDAMTRSMGMGEQLSNTAVTMTNAPLVGVSRTLAMTAANFSVEYIKGLTDAMRAQITDVVRRGALGGLSVKDAIDQVGRSLTAPGRFKSIAARAEAIVRTEVMRIQAIAAHARMLTNRESMRRVGYDLEKKWLTSHDARVRVSHQLTEGQQKPLDEPFDVAALIGGDALLVEQLMYPRDPAGSARNTVNCRCVAIPVVIKMA